MNGWILCEDKLPDNEEYDWVLAQVMENDGFLWIPRVMEYREARDDWYCEELGWLSKYDDAFKVIAWTPLPTFGEANGISPDTLVRLLHSS